MTTFKTKLLQNFSWFWSTKNVGVIFKGGWWGARSSPYWGMGGLPPLAKNLLIPTSKNAPSKFPCHWRKFLFPPMTGEFNLPLAIGKSLFLVKTWKSYLLKETLRKLRIYIKRVLEGVLIEIECHWKETRQCINKTW